MYIFDFIYIDIFDIYIYILDVYIYKYLFIFTFLSCQILRFASVFCKCVKMNIGSLAVCGFLMCAMESMESFI